MPPAAAPPAETPSDVLERVARWAGTPCYAYDLARLRLQLDLVRRRLPPSVEVLYSLKANPASELVRVIAERGFGADVASAQELAIALEAGFDAGALFVSGPYKPPPLIERIRMLTQARISVDSVSELSSLDEAALDNALLLRLRPDFVPQASMPMGPGSRFGIPRDELACCRPLCRKVVGFHLFAGSQILEADAVVRHLRLGLELALRAADLLGLEPTVFNLGGGFGVPYGAEERELDLGPIGEELERLAARVAPARVVLELGRYLVAQCGWYLTRVVARQRHLGRAAVVVDGGVHQRADLCGLGLRSRALPPRAVQPAAEPREATDVLGCLCLPADVLAEASPLPPLAVGDLLAFPNAGAYGLSASPTLFLSHPPPAEILFEELEGGRLSCLPGTSAGREILPPSSSTDRRFAGAPA